MARAAGAVVLVREQAFAAGLGVLQGTSQRGEERKKNEPTWMRWTEDYDIKSEDQTGCAIHFNVDSEK